MNGDHKVQKYLFPEKNYSRQEIHKYFCTSVNRSGPGLIAFRQTGLS